MDAAARIGTTLKGKWRIERLIGTGGFASVYAATHRAGKRVAIKVLHVALGASDDMRRRFLKEAYAANAVGHRAVVEVFDDDVTEDGAPFLVMDLLEGDTVEARRRKAGGKIEVAGVLFVVDEVLDALAAAHAKGIVHRDIKPDNLFMTVDGHVKILDFGIARFREPGEQDAATQTGFAMGSPGFMAPEQARGRWSEVDARTDVYAVGATMFLLLSGRKLRAGRNLNEALIEAATVPAPPLSSVAPGVSRAVADLVDRAIAFEKEDRWPDAGAMRAAVRKARSSLTGAGGTLPLGALPIWPGPAPASDAPCVSSGVPAAGSPGPAVATAPLPATERNALPGAGKAPIPPGQAPVATSPLPLAVSSPRAASSPPADSPAQVASSPPTASPVAVTAAGRVSRAAVGGARALPLLFGSIAAAAGLGALVLWRAARPLPPPSPSALASPPESVTLAVTAGAPREEGTGAPGGTGLAEKELPPAAEAADSSASAAAPARTAGPAASSAGARAVPAAPRAAPARPPPRDSVLRAPAKAGSPPSPPGRSPPVAPAWDALEGTPNRR